MTLQICIHRWDGCLKQAWEEPHLLFPLKDTWLSSKMHDVASSSGGWSGRGRQSRRGRQGGRGIKLTWIQGHLFIHMCHGWVTQPL